MHAVEAILPVWKKLLRWDPAGDDMLLIKPARAGESMQRTALFTEVRFEQDEDGDETRVFRAPGDRQAMIECWLTFVESTLQERVPLDIADPEQGTRTQDMFPKGLSQMEFESKWRTLDEPLWREWWACVLEVNPQWDDFGAGRAKVSKA